MLEYVREFNVKERKRLVIKRGDFKIGGNVIGVGGIGISDDTKAKRTIEGKIDGKPQRKAAIGTNESDIRGYAMCHLLQTEMNGEPAVC